MIATLCLYASDTDSPARRVACIKYSTGFVPAGWKLEEQIDGDLNGDGIADHALKLIEDKPAMAKDETMNDGGRALVLVFEDKDGKFRSAAVADKLLQCASCGGAFYGVSPAPANVKIQKGVLVVEQDHGSRDVTDVTFRFRFDEQPNMFILIGFDYSSRDRAELRALFPDRGFIEKYEGISTQYRLYHRPCSCDRPGYGRWISTLLSDHS